MVRIPAALALAALGLASCESDPTPAADAAPVVDHLPPLRDQAPPPDTSIPDAGWPDLPAPDLLAPDLVPPALPGCIQGTFNAYFGNFHSHTAYSDGDLTPKDAFQHARDVAKLDILIVTDHLEQLYLPLPDDRYGKCKAAAASEGTSTFLADCGFEYGSGFNLLLSSTGHNNVFFSPTLLPAIQLDFHDFYKTLVACKTCVGQFNHPGSDKDQHWNNFEYHSDVDERINLFEFNSTPAWDMFFQALDAGWHLSPMYNQDNHDADWGSKNDRRSGAYLTLLDLTALRAAMLDRRTFMTYDKNAAIKMMADDLCWMGSILTQTSSLKLTVEATDADSTDTFGKIRLYGKGKAELAVFDCQDSNPCSAVFTVQAAQSPYFVARVEQADGDYLVSAPIWLAP